MDRLGSPTLSLRDWRLRRNLDLLAPTGREPKLLAEKEDGLIVARFGQIVDPPE